MPVRRIVCFGDSNTWGYNPATRDRYPENVRWTGLVQAELGNNYRIIEEGQNSRTIALDDPCEGEKNGMMHIVPVMESQKPFDVLIIMLGTNDLKQKFGLSPLDIYKAMQLFLEKALSFARYHMNSIPKILLIAPPLIGDNIRNSRLGPSYAFEKGIQTSRQLSPLFKELASQYGCDFRDASEIVKTSSIDSIHLNEESHKIFASMVVDYIRSAFPD